MNEVGIAHNGSVHVGVDYFDIIPVWTCSRNVSKRCSFSESRPHINVPTTAPRKPRGSDTTVGLTSGHNASAPRIAGPNYSPDAGESVPLILFPEGCAYRRCAVAALKDQKRSWHVSFVSPSFDCLKSAAVEGMGITVLARALVAPPLRVVRHGLRLPQLPTVELVYSFGRRSNSRVVSELANYLADSLTNAGTMRNAPMLS
jgi:DNA-binding transcriptional LysR family regulator